jgi:pimeloyl-ACP methyl ester carboxylesterase
MAELPFLFDLPDDKKLYGILQAVDDAAAPVVVFVHGLGGHMREKAIKFAAYAVVEAGYTALRVNLYDAEPDARKLVECTIDTHVSDVTLVLRQIRESGRKIAIVGHGLGGLVIQRQPRELFDVAVLWDPTDAEAEDISHWSDARYDPATGNYELLWTSDLVMTPAFFDSWWKSLPDHHDLGCPTLVVEAGESDLKAECERYTKAQSGPSELFVIEGAEHNFSSREATEALYVETVRWSKQYL